MRDGFRGQIFRVRLIVAVQRFDILVAGHAAEFERVGVNSCEMDRGLMAKVMKREVPEAGFVRHIPTGSRWSFAKACERAGLTWKSTPHHLRHSVAS